MPTITRRDDRKDDDPTVRDIAASASPGGSTTGNAPDPRLKGPLRDRPPQNPHVQLGTGPVPARPRQPVSLFHPFYAFPTYGYES